MGAPKETSALSDTAYPDAPWRLRGFGFQTFRVIDIEAARAFVPHGSQIVPVWPGKTVGSVYFASYEDGSTLVYHEIVVAAALIWAGNRVGVALPRLYVDNPASYAGGHAIWGAPKEMAEFTVNRSAVETVIGVHQEGQEIMSLRFGAAGKTFPGWMPLPSFGVRGDELTHFTPRVRSGMTMIRANVSLPADSPFLPLHLDGSSFAFAYPDLQLTVPAANVVGRINTR